MILAIFINIAICTLFVGIAARLNATMDKYMIEYMDLSDNQKTLEYYKKVTPSWWSFDWRAKYENLQFGKRAYNKLLLKVGIKTRLLSDNCNDAWHFLKSCMIVLLIVAITLQGISLYKINLGLSKIVLLKCFEFIFYGYIWNANFNNQFNTN